MSISAPARQPWPASGAAARAMRDRDLILWSEDQARLLRARRFAELDIEHLAEEIEGMGKSERRDLAGRMARLTAHLLAWRCQPESRTGGLRATICDARKRIALALKETPSLRTVLRDQDWQDGVWLDARVHARTESGVKDDALPDACPWTMEQAADPDFWPAAPKPQPFAVGLSTRLSGRGG
jgi:Domain of unknown function DUF29